MIKQVDKNTRVVELYIGYGDSEGGQWNVEDCLVDASLSQEDALTQAVDNLVASLDPRAEYAFIGLYAFWTDEMMDSFREGGVDGDIDDDYMLGFFANAHK